MKALPYIGASTSIPLVPKLWTLVKFLKEYENS